MKTIVMKFGGYSLAEIEKIKIAAQRVAYAKKKGYAVILVLSAPADITDDLNKLAERTIGINNLTLTAKKPIKRELSALLTAGEQISVSLMAMLLNKQGTKAASFNAWQAQIITNNTHTQSKILKIKTKNIKNALRKGTVAVVAGFQGINKLGEITTLGRGGSDLTAVALSEAFKAEICELYTDVKGIYTTNPSINPQAKKIKYITYAELKELSSCGFEVRQLKAIDFAKKHKIKLHIRSAFHEQSGTIVSFEKSSSRKKNMPACVTLKRTVQHEAKQAKVYIIGQNLKDNPNILSVIKKISQETKISLKKIKITAHKMEITINFSQGEKFLKIVHKAFFKA
ncbi:MAG: aspartate kinase [Elusimicrobia bacterium]|nr:aspartate kinase [Elusimicrobiota bacterium]